MNLAIAINIDTGHYRAVPQDDITPLESVHLNILLLYCHASKAEKS